MKINTAEFITSIGNITTYKDFDMPEITFVGRSNVGKSSLINALTNYKKLAKTSSLAGRTRLVNLFLINQRFILVDLPGYGYAKAGKNAQKEWQSLIEAYLQKSNKLKMVFVLVDIRLKPSDLDKQMLQYLYYYNMPFKVLATKSDKLMKSQIKPYVHQIAIELGLGDADIIPVSAQSKYGLNEVLEFMDDVLDYDKLKPNTNLLKTPKGKSDNSASKKRNEDKQLLKINKLDKINSHIDNKKNSKIEDTKKIKHTPRYILKKRKGKK